MSRTSRPEGEERLVRGAAALSRFVFPGYIVPREEMAAAVLAAADDADEGWLSRLPARRIAVGDDLVLEFEVCNRCGQPDPIPGHFRPPSACEFASPRMVRVIEVPSSAADDAPAPSRRLRRR
jgi:hypothetical protein